MKVQIDNHVYLVGWKHERISKYVGHDDSKGYHYDHSKGGYTTCYIKVEINTHDKPLFRSNGDRLSNSFTLNNGTLVYVGVANCSISDTYCKQSGRKVSLARALQQLFPGNRNLRKLFWAAYDQQIGLSKRNKEDEQ